jgi:hypothetical protein
MILRTHRLTLRPQTQGDAPALFAILGDSEAMRFWSRPALSHPALVEALITEQQTAAAGGLCRYWTVLEDGDPIGSVDLSLMRSLGPRPGDGGGDRGGRPGFRSFAAWPPGGGSPGRKPGRHPGAGKDRFRMDKTGPSAARRGPFGSLRLLCPYPKSRRLMPFGAAGAHG